MKKLFIVVFILLIAATDHFTQSFYTGAIGVTQSNGGRTRIFSDNLTTRQIDRTSILVGVSSTAVFDYDQDQQGIVNAATVGSPQLSDFEVTSTIDNTYNNPPLPPNVEAKIRLFGWTNGAYILAKINVKNREASPINAAIGFEFIPQNDGAYGGETVQWNAASQILTTNKVKWVGYKIFSGAQVSCKIIPWVSGFANDAFFYSAMTQNSFDPPLTAGPDGAVGVSAQAPVTIAAGDSVNFWYGIALGDDLNGVVANMNLCHAKYLVTVPVEFTSFTAVPAGNMVNINWSTATETNNQAFELERRTNENPEWVVIGFKNGAGTTTQPQSYSLSDNISALNSEKIYYRLKQIDFNGNYSYSNEIEIDNLYAPEVYLLAQNYPNPFNPATSISFGIPEKSNVMLRVYNTIGEEVALIAAGVFEAGTYNFNFDASNLPSGNYIYVLQTDKTVISKKMTLLK